MEAKTKNRISIIAIAMLFITPVVLTIVLNSNLIDFKPGTFKNKGEFIQPAVKYPAVADELLDSKTWTVVYHTASDCEQSCIDRMEMMHRVRLTRGHKMDRVKLLVAHPETKTVTIPDAFKEIEKISYAVGSKSESVLTKLSDKSLSDNEGLFILAPEGFFMMSYASDFQPDDVIDDLSLLLRGRKGE